MIYFNSKFPEVKRIGDVFVDCIPFDMKTFKGIIDGTVDGFVRTRSGYPIEVSSIPERGPFIFTAEILMEDGKRIRETYTSDGKVRQAGRWENDLLLYVKSLGTKK